MSDFICGPLSSLGWVDYNRCREALGAKKIDTPVGAGCGGATTVEPVEKDVVGETAKADLPQDAQGEGIIPFSDIYRWLDIKDASDVQGEIPFLDIVYSDILDEISYPEEVSYPDEATLTDEFTFLPDQASIPDELSYPDEAYLEIPADESEAEVVGPQPLCIKKWEAGESYMDHYGGYPIIADLDNNGTKEIITWFWHGVWQDGYCVDWTRRLYVLEHSGENYPGWPLNLNANALEKCGNPAFIAYPRIVAGDMDGDGDKEIVIWDVDKNNNPMIRAFHHDATAVAGWPIFGNNLPGEPSMADLDGDGKVEIIGKAKTTDLNIFELYVFNSDGSLTAGWPKEVGKYNFALGDIDGDGKAEIVTKGAGNEGQVHAYNYDSTEAANFPLPVSPYPGSSGSYKDTAPVVLLGDVDNNGSLDIVVQTYIQQAGEVAIFNNQGDELYGFPIAEGSCASLRSMGDVDSDDDLEIIVNNLCVNSLYGENLRIYHHDGILLNGWPLEVETYYHLFFSPIADLDGDGEAEIVGALNHGSSYVLPQFYIYNNDASVEVNFNYTDGGNADIYEAAIVDLNNDGYLELITGGYDHYVGGKVKVWQCGPAENWSAVQWPAFGHDARWTWNYETPIE